MSNSYCGGWRQNKPEPYQLVLIRELSPLVDRTIDKVHVGFWSNTDWCILPEKWCNNKKSPKGMFKGFKGISIINIYGWKELKSALE